jgi:membrane-associated HD superfamily phosphohydrolase
MLLWLHSNPGTSAAATAASSKAAKAAAKQDKRNAKLKEKRAAEALAGKKPVPALKTETEQFSKNIKGVKSRTRQLVQQGIPAKAAQKMATKAVTGTRLQSAT